MKKLSILVFCFVLMAQAAEQRNDSTPDQALAKLMEGNKRYASSHSQHPHQSTGRRHELEKTQHPFACILSCSDSRVSPEIVFDEGLGDLFVVRVAGNIVDDAVMGSIEYAVEHLGTPLRFGNFASGASGRRGHEMAEPGGIAELVAVRKGFIWL